MTQLLTVPDVADRLGCSLRHVYRLIEAGAIKTVDIRTPGSRRSKLRVTQRALDRLASKER